MVLRTEVRKHAEIITTIHRSQRDRITVKLPVDDEKGHENFVDRISTNE